MSGEVYFVAVEAKQGLCVQAPGRAVHMTLQPPGPSKCTPLVCNSTLQRRPTLLLNM